MLSPPLFLPYLLSIFIPFRLPSSRFYPPFLELFVIVHTPFSHLSLIKEADLNIPSKFLQSSFSKSFKNIIPIFALTFTRHQAFLHYSLTLTSFTSWAAHPSCSLQLSILEVFAYVFVSTTLENVSSCSGSCYVLPVFMYGIHNRAKSQTEYYNTYEPPGIGDSED
jgi:hypothetical protein